MKIVFVSHHARLHGAEMCLWELLRGLAGSGHEFELICPEEGPLMDRARELGARTTVVPFASWAGGRASGRTKLRVLRVNAAAVARLRRHFRLTKPDLVVTSTLTIPSGAIAARLAGVPHILYAQEFGVPAHNMYFHLGRERSIRLLGRVSTLVLVASEALKQDLGTIIKGRELRVIYYAADVGDLSALPGRAPAGPGVPLRLTLLGFKTPGKGQDQAIRAVGLLHDRGVDASLALVGSGRPDHVERLQQLARDLDVADRVEFVGYVEGNPFAYFTQADAALSCSEYEGLPRVVVEAMKCGCPVVGARSGGTADLIRDGWNGYLYEPGDAASLAHRLEQLAADRAATAVLGENAARWAHERFTIERYAADLLAAATDATAGARRARRT